MLSWSFIYVLSLSCFNLLQDTHSVEVDIEFINYAGVYACEALNVFISDTGEEVDIFGQHLENSSNDQVKSLGFYSSTVKTICNGIFKVFPNLEILKVEG